jgi:hypothetical protein
MKIEQLESIVDDLWKCYKADPPVLYLTADSQSELSDEIIGDPNDPHYFRCPPPDPKDPPIQGGAIVTSYLNRWTGSEVLIERADGDFDYLDTRLYLL